MYLSKSKQSIDDQNSTDVRSYAIIETDDANELEHIIDLLRQFFPRTKVIEYKSYPQRSPSETEEQISSNVNSPVRKRKY